MLLRSSFTQCGLDLSRTLKPQSTQFRQLTTRIHPLSRPVSRIATLPPRPRANPLLLTGIGLTSLSITSYFTLPTTRFDASPFSTSSENYAHGRDAKIPLSKDGGRTLNPAAIRQISLGSILGLGAGVIISAFSKMLVLVLGLGIVASQFAARRGFNILPVDKVQRYVKGVNLRSAINDNAAFKISFGLMFALTAFGEL